MPRLRPRDRKPVAADLATPGLVIRREKENMPASRDADWASSRYDHGKHVMALMWPATGILRPAGCGRAAILAIIPDIWRRRGAGPGQGAIGEGGQER
jgi:hypothetical protein